MTFTPETIKLLETPLDPKNVKKADSSKGIYGDYIEGWHAINEANRIFGFGAWSYEIDLKHLITEKNNNGNFEATYSCIATVTVGDTKRQGVGHGSGFSKKEGAAHEGAAKEAETDGLKRALRSFGNQFGLALYDKTQANVSAPPVEYLSDEQRDNISAMASAAGVDLGAICDGYNAKSLNQIPADKFDNITNRLKATIQANVEKKAK